MLGAGTQIGAYTIEGVIGRGGMGVVYRASQAPLGRVVALKLLSPELSSDQEFRARFRQEAALLASIEHPNIVPMYEASQTEEGMYIAMRLIPGPNLKGLIRAAQLSPGRTIALLRGVSRALDSAHAKHLIHRDVKPANVLVVEDHAYLADFGLTKDVEVDSITSSDRLLGTLDYMPPELIRGEDADGRSDVYSLGAVLYECLTGKVPFPRKTDVAVMYAQLEQRPPSVRATRPELPDAIDDVIRRAMAKRAEDRPESAAEVIDAAADALEDAGHSTTVRAPTVTNGGRGAGPDTAARAGSPTIELAATESVPRERRPEPRARTGARRRRRVVALLAAVLVAIGAGLVAGESGQAHAQPPSKPLEARYAIVDVPRAWTTRPPGSPIPRLFLNDASTVVPPGVAGAAPPGTPDAGVLIGRTPAFGPGLLPESIHSYASFTTAATAVRLGRLDALNYDDVRSKDGRRRIDLFLVPTTRDVIAVACYGPVGKPDGGALEDCPEIAQTLRMTRGKPFPLGARAAYQHLLGGVFSGLAAREAQLVAALGAARTTAGQSAAAFALADAYSRAAAHLSHLKGGLVSPTEGGIHYTIRDSLRGVSRAWQALAVAASDRSKAQWSIAVNGVLSAVNQLGASLGELTKLGYVIT